MSRHPLGDCLVKLNRADVHLKALDSTVQRFFKSNAQVVVEELDPQAPSSKVEIETRNTPIDWGPLFGDVLYNLRSCLDHLAWRLAERGQGAVARKTAWPIFKDRREYERAGRGGGLYKIAELLPADQDTVKDFQPCYRTKPPATDPLWLFEKLSNFDKHRQLHTTVVDLPESPGPFATFRKQPGRDLWDVLLATAVLFSVDKPKKVAELAPGDRIRISLRTQGDLQPPFVVAFDQPGEVFDGQEAMPLLRRIRDEVGGILTAFGVPMQPSK